MNITSPDTLKSFKVAQCFVVDRNQRIPKGDLKIDETEAQSEPEQDSEMWEPDGSDQDSLELFFASVCQSTRRLPKRFQNQIKRQVLDVLLRVEEQCENEMGESKTGLYKT